MKKYVLVTTLSLLVVGCGLTPVQKQQVSQFASATESISVSSQEQFKNTRDKMVEIERRRLIMRNQTPPSDIDLDGGINVNGVATLVSTLDVLKSYGELLNKLASNDQSEALGKAATEFSSSFESLRQLDSKGYTLPEEKKDAFEGAVKIVGSWFVEEKKKKSLIKVVKAYSPEVSNLAELLVNDLVLKGSSLCLAKEDRNTSNIKTGVIDHYCTSAKALRKASIDVLKGTGYSFSEREFAYNSFVVSDSAIEEVGLLSKSGGKVIEKFKKANAELLKSVETEKFTSEKIKSYSGQVKELNTLIGVLTN